MTEQEMRMRSALERCAAPLVGGPAKVLKEAVERMQIAYDALHGTNGYAAMCTDGEQVGKEE